MAHQHSPPSVPQGTEFQAADPYPDSDRDSGVGDDAGEDSDGLHDDNALHWSRGERDVREGGVGDFTIFVAFQGNMEDEDFPEKLDRVLNGIPSILELGKDTVGQ